jgi:hypothetical protein
MQSPPSGAYYGSISIREALVVSATQRFVYVLKGHDFSRAANGVE